MAHTDDSSLFEHCIADGTYIIVSVEQDTKRVRVPNRSTGDKQKDGQKDGQEDGQANPSIGKTGRIGKTGNTGNTGNTNKNERDEALYVEPPKPDAKEVDKYEQVCFYTPRTMFSVVRLDHVLVFVQWNIKRVPVPEEEKKRAKHHWRAYYTIQNVGSSKYAWTEDEVTHRDVPVMEHESPRIWGINPVARNTKTMQDECLYVAYSVALATSIKAGCYSHVLFLFPVSNGQTRTTRPSIGVSMKRKTRRTRRIKKASRTRALLSMIS